MLMALFSWVFIFNGETGAGWVDFSFFSFWFGSILEFLHFKAEKPSRIFAEMTAGFHRDG